MKLNLKIVMVFIKNFVLLFVASFIISAEVQSQYSWVNAYPNLPVFFRPVEMKFPPDTTNRVFIVEQRGVIWSFDNSQNVTTRDTFMSIADRVEQSGSETGLLGLAFHPDFVNNGYFYLNYTTIAGGPRVSRISRFNLDSSNPNKGDKNSEMILMTVGQPFSNHNGGCLDFGPDGYLYISLGDGGSGGDPGNRAQNTNELLGKILRIDIDTTHAPLNYGIPPTNPFADSSSTAYKREIYAWGIRNTWKFSFDMVLDSLWGADVGQSAREEINVIRVPGNYGWRCYEGFLPYNTSGCGPASDYIFPIFDYPRSAGISVTGGYVYRGTKFPDLDGKYIYGDYGSGRTWMITHEGGTTTNELLQATGWLISSFGQDNNGEMYLVRYGTAVNIYKLEGPNSITLTNSEIPSDYSLKQNYPNPFNPQTKIEFSIPKETNVTLKVYDISGKLVETLLDNMHLNPGNYSKTYIPQNIPSGIYFYRLETESFVDSKRMVLVK